MTPLGTGFFEKVYRARDATSDTNALSAADESESHAERNSGSG